MTLQTEFAGHVRGDVSEAFMNRQWLVLMSALGVVLGVSGCTQPVEIIAHRGASYLAPENTLSAVRLGWEMHADVEIDVHLSRDNQIVVIHDASTKHITGVDLKVHETTSDELRRLDYGSHKGPQFAGETLPFLSEVLDTIPPGRKLYIEIKCGKEILPFLEQAVMDGGKASQVVIIGFDLDTVTSAKQRLGLPTYWLRGTRKTEDTEEWIPHDPNWVQSVVDRGLDGLDVHYAGVHQDFVAKAKAAGQRLYVWTVDDPQEAKRLVQLGVNGITTNRPGWLRQQIRR